MDVKVQREKKWLLGLIYVLKASFVKLPDEELFKELRFLL
jgi:hypothetical protein